MQRIKRTTYTGRHRPAAQPGALKVTFILVALVSLSLVLAPGPSSAQQLQWQYGTGTYTVTDSVGSVTRSVEAWVAPDGTYRVLTTSLNRSNASEEVVFDGVKQFAYITDDAGIL